MSNRLDDIFDPFAFLILTIATLLSFADWLIGESQRQRMRDAVGYWWLYVDDISWTGLAAKDAALTRKMLQRVFGNHLLSFRCIVTVAILSVSCFFFATLVSLSINEPHLSWNVILFGSLTPTYFARSAAVVICLGWLSLCATDYFLKVMSGSTSLATLLVLAILDILVALSLAATAWFLTVSVVLAGVSGMEMKDSYDGFSFAAVFHANVATGLIPSACHFGVAVAFMGSKLASPIFKPPIGAVLRGFHESKKGVLTSIAIGLSVACKLLHEWLKYAGFVG